MNGLKVGCGVEVAGRGADAGKNRNDREGEERQAGVVAGRPEGKDRDEPKPRALGPDECDRDDEQRVVVDPDERRKEERADDRGTEGAPVAVFLTREPEDR